MAFRQRFARSLLYTSGAAAVGGGILYYTYRPRNIPGLDSAVVPPFGYGADGKFHPPRFPKVKSRAEQIADLKRSGGSKGASAASTPQNEDDVYDLLVIGGGATGSGIALDAATRGLKVAVVERDDFSSGTSSKSTKLVHGGVRYLEKAVWELDYNQYALVKEALRERKYFLDTAPHLSSWLPIMLPLDKWWKAPYYWAGTKCYDFLAGSEGIETSYFLTRSKALDAFPMLKKDNLVGALVYYDGAHNDSRMNVSLAMTAALYGGTVVNHLEVTSLEKDANGRLCGAKVRDLIDEKDGKKPQEFNIRARGIINATGPFTDAIRKMDDQEVKEIVAPSSGVHVILPGYYSPQKMGLIDPKTSDGRVIFFLPWQGNTIAGTTDAPTQIEYNPVAGEKEIDWILSEIRHYLAPDINVRRGDVLAAWSGIRPLVKNPNAKNTEALVRNHLINVSPSGLLTCAGGKWTTYRQMAEECVDEAIKEFKLQPRPVTNAPNVSGSELIDDGARLDGSCQTHQVKLIGAHGFSKTLFINLIQHFGVETDIAKHLTESYGDRAWTVAALSSPTEQRFPVRGKRISPLYPFVDGEIRYAVRHEYAQTAVDVLARRTRLAFLNAQAALEATPKVIDIMAEELNWSSKRKDVEWTDSMFPIVYSSQYLLPLYFGSFTRSSPSLVPLTTIIPILSRFNLLTLRAFLQLSNFSNQWVSLNLSWVRRENRWRAGSWISRTRSSIKCTRGMISREMNSRAI
ncbi:mitochondrial glycerol-3-phosphate dehydrogenase [Clarireedia jacksonii]